MKGHFTALLIVVAVAIGAAAQQPEFTAPIKWETYTDGDVGFGVSFPKIPLRHYSGDFCSNNELFSYFAYAEEVVYKVAIQKLRILPFGCKSKTIFSSTDEFDRIVSTNLLTTQRATSGLKFAKLIKNDSISWFLDDHTTNRLIEMSIFHREGAKVDEQKFLRSFHTGRELKGTPIYKGSEQVLGDVVDYPQDTSNQTASTQKATDLVAYKIVHTPKARYTDEARKYSVQGSVILKITLLANGTVGNVTVIKELSHGLTEEAIKAAKQIVFLPRKRNGVNVPIIISREYVFSIY